MPPVKFTEQWLAALQPAEKPVTYWDATVTGFCLLVGVAARAEKARITVRRVAV